MSSSGKWRQTNTNHHQRQNKNNIHKTQIRNESTNMFMCNLCLMYVLHIYIQESILPGYNSTKSLASFQDPLSLSPFLRSTDIWSDGNESMMNRVNLELANGWNTSHQLFSLLHRLQGNQKECISWVSPKRSRRASLSALSSLMMLRCCYFYSFYKYLFFGKK